MKRRYLKRTAVIFSGAVLLFLGLYGTFWSFLSAFSLLHDGGALLWGCLGVTAAGTVIFSLPRLKHRLPLVLLWAAGLLWTVWSRFSSLTLGALAAFQRVGGLYAQKIPGLPSPAVSEYIGTLTLRGESEATTLLLGVFLCAYGLLLSWLVVGRRSFWASFWCTFPILLLPLAITVTPNRLPLSALLLFWAVGLLARLFAKQDAVGYAKTVLLTTPLTALLLFCLGLFVPFERYEQPAWAVDTRLALLDKVVLAGRDLVSGAGGIIGGSGGAVDVDLSKAGPLRYTGKPVLRVESEVSGHIYLRGFSAAAYTEDGWEQLGDEDYRQMRDGWRENTGPDGIRISADQYLMYGGLSSGASFGGIGEYQPLNFPALADQSAPHHKFTVESVGAASPYVYTPYQLSTTPDRMTGAEFVGDAYLARGVGVWRYVLYAKNGAEPERADLSGAVWDAEMNYRRFVQRHYLQVPEDLWEALAGVLTESFENAQSRVWNGLDQERLEQTPPPVRTAWAVADLLDSIADYNAEAPLTPEGEDFVLCFLERGQGYCMHFASAATLLLRTLGVPARYVTGYTVDAIAGQTVSVPDSNAHAWVEVYVDGFGWVPVEVTPGQAGSAPWESTGVMGGISPSPTPSVSVSPSPTPSSSHSQPPRDQSGGAPAPEPERPHELPWFLICPLIPIALFWCFHTRRELAAKGRKKRFTQKDRNRAVLELYVYARRLARRLPAGTLDSRPVELAEKAKFSQHQITPAEHSEMANYTLQLSARVDGTGTWYQKLFWKYIVGLY